MGYYQHLFYTLSVIFSGLKLTDGAGVIEIKFVEYTNINGYKIGNPQQCCDLPSIKSSMCKTDPCDPIFDICLQNVSLNGCSFGRQTTGFTDNSNTIRFSSVIGSNNTYNPLRFPVSGFFHDQVVLTLTIYDEDQRAGQTINDKIDYMQQVVNFIPDVNGTKTTILNYTLIGQVSSLYIEMNVRCGTFYYGSSCTKRCRPTKSSDCTNSGDKSCLPGWTGTNCAINIDDCANHICQNGARCHDRTNNYTCDCQSGFTGRYCESVITTSTPSTLTTLTSTSTPSTLTTLTSTSTPSTTTTFTSTSTPSSTTTFTSTSIPSTSTTFRSTSTPISTTIFLSTSTPSTTTAFTSTSIPPTSTTFSSISTPSTRMTVKTMTSTLTTDILSTATHLSPVKHSSSKMTPSIMTKLSSLRKSSPSRSTFRIPSSTVVASTLTAGVMRLTCMIIDIDVRLYPENVTVTTNVSGTFNFDNFRQYLNNFLRDQMQSTATTILRSQTLLKTFRQIAFDIQLQATTKSVLDVDKLKTAIRTFCIPHASKYGRNQMPEPVPSDNNPGPVIGGVFGGLAVTAVAAVTGFFIYKRKLKPTSSDPEAKSNMTNAEKTKVSKESSRHCGDGDSLNEADFDKEKMKHNTHTAVKEPEIQKDTSFADGSKMVDF